MPIEIIKDNEVNGSEGQFDNTIEKHQVNIGGSILPAIEIPFPVATQKNFQPNNTKV
jgi:hypothetical protein